MQVILSAEQMKAAERFTMDTLGVPSLVLMERAALEAVRMIHSLYLEQHPSPVLVVCGSGNNGGDGFAAARLLLEQGCPAEVFFVGKECRMTPECAHQRSLFLSLGGNMAVEPEWRHYGVIVDALFGIGLNRAVEGDCEAAIRKINETKKEDPLKRILSMDIPSGISADHGAVMGCAVKADDTVTFSYLKKGLCLYPGAEYCGRVHLADAGIYLPPSGDGSLFSAGDHTLPRIGCAYALEDKDLDEWLPVRHARSHKGIYGKALLAAGGRNMAGAALLAAKACSRSGCGLTFIFADPSNRIILQSQVPEAVFLPWAEADEMTDPDGFLPSGITAVGAGPGLGRSELAETVLKRLCSIWPGAMVLDADALNIIAGLTEEEKEQMLCKKIVTPHPAEMSRLTGKTTGEILNDLPGSAMSFARKYHAICVLKDAASVITDGETLFINRSGCDGMASGGSGDVLTGLITGLAAQGMDPFRAAVLGVYVHGKAGEETQAVYGPRGMTAADLSGGIAAVLHK